MRIIQVIDSLEVGGAERMAVNYANALAKKIDFSGLVTTRAEGNLKNNISVKVSYLFLERKRTLDINAVFRLKRYCKQNDVDYVHAHSSSFFIAVLLKLIYPGIKIIWHDHNGLSEFIHSERTLPLKLASILFDKIIVVNYKLKEWAEKSLFCKEVIYFPNFTNGINILNSETQLKGREGKRILCLANLREQKNHFLLLDVAKKIRASNPDWTFHLVGKDFGDEYSRQIKELIISEDLGNNVFIYGSKNDVENIINQSDIAVLTSKSEGLPVALIECGLLKKPFVSTKVGEIPLIIKDGINGFTVEVNDCDLFCQKLEQLINNSDLRNAFGNSFYQIIVENHSEDGVIDKYLNCLKECN